jgi:hypothetical protein
MCVVLSRKLRCSIGAELAQRVLGISSVGYKRIGRGMLDERLFSHRPLEFDMDVEETHDTAINALVIISLVLLYGIDANVWFK